MVKTVKTGLNGMISDIVLTPSIVCPYWPWGYDHVYDHYFRTSQKVLGQSKPNYMKSIHGSGEGKVWGYLGHDKDGHYTKGENPSKLFFSRQEEPMTLYFGM